MSQAPHRHEAWICSSKSTTKSSIRCHYGPRLCSARKQNHDNDEFWFVVIMVLEAHAKRRKHDDEELSFSLLWSSDLQL
jgi:hypothetical protein